MLYLLSWVTGIGSYLCLFLFIYTSQSYWLILAIAAWFTAAGFLIYQERKERAKYSKRLNRGEDIPRIY